MISSYEIRNINNEDVLYLYFDFDNEFSRMNFEKAKDKLEDTIKKFINENKILFTGTTVALVVGSTVFANIILNNDNKLSTYENPITIVEKIDNQTTDEISKEEIIDNEKAIVDGSDKIINTMQNQIKNDDNTSIKRVKDNKTITNTTNKENKKQTNKVTKEENNQQVKDDKIYIKIKGSSGQVQSLELEEYIIGVVGAEMPASFSEQALMAQAIIARTYALNSNSKGKTLTDNESTQSYKSNDELKTIWGNSYNTYYTKIKNAVMNTKGMYLTYNGKYIDAVYHSTSNGYTEDSKNVWGNAFPYLVSVESKYDSLNPSFIKQKSIPYEELSNKLNMNINKETTFNILSKTSGNRVDNIEIGGKTYKGVDLRNILGLRSADFDIEKKEEGVIFTTRGYGHGVGLSQYGANGMAKNGYSYVEILKHYYKGVSISHL